MTTFKSLYLGVAVGLCIASLSWAQFQSKTFEAYTSVGITDTDNISLLHGNTKSGDLVQLIWVGPDGNIDEPDSSAATTADDSLLGVSHIGYGYPFNPDQGLFAAFFRHDLIATGLMVYVRAWNDSAVTSTSAYGNSLPYTINSDFDSHDFGLDFRAPNSWRMHGGVIEVPVELIAFTASDEGGQVRLHWATASETDNLGFNLYRKVARDSTRSRLNDRLIDGAMNAQTLHDYEYRDHLVQENQQYFYWLSDVSAKGLEIMHGPISVLTGTLPDAYALQQNYPNPFNPTTSIAYTVKDPGPVQVRVFNIRGQLVRELANGVQSAGPHSVMWDGCDANGLQVPSGTYLCSMEAGNYHAVIKMTMTK